MAERAADEAAYGRRFPDDVDEYGRLLSQLDADDIPRDGEAWAAVRSASLLRGYYPPQQVGAWFTVAGVAQPNFTTMFSQRSGAACEKFMSDVIFEGIQKSTLDGREDLRKLLAEIAKSERRLANQLRQLLGEATRPGHAGTGRGRQIRRIYSGIFDHLLTGLADAARLRTDQRSSLLSLIPTIETENHYYVGGRVMWEAGLRRSANWITQLLKKREFWASLPSAGRQSPRARARFIYEMMEIWLDCTGAPATFSENSPFYRFMRSAYGHMRGLRQAANPQGIEQRLRDLHLGSIPTARTMKNDLGRLEIQPPK